MARNPLNADFSGAEIKLEFESIYHWTVSKEGLAEALAVCSDDYVGRGRLELSTLAGSIKHSSQFLFKRARQGCSSEQDSLASHWCNQVIVGDDDCSSSVLGAG